MPAGARVRARAGSELVQMANKKFKTTIEASAGSLREEIKGMQGFQHKAVLPHEQRAVPTGEEEKSLEQQLQEMRSLLKVKDQMVWMMLEERGQLQSKLSEKDATIKALEVRASLLCLLYSEFCGIQEELEEWKNVCEKWKSKVEAKSKAEEEEEEEEEAVKP
eukprot:756071-Hanusia_phi.AAC.3